MPHRLHRPQHPLLDEADVYIDGLPEASSSTSADIVYQSRSAERPRTRIDRSQHPLVLLPIPLLHRGSRSMSAVPTKQSLVAADDSTQPTPLDTNGLGSRKTTKFLAVMRRSNSYSHRKSGKGSLGRGMFSTPEERSAPINPALSRTASPIRSAEPPSIAQIAMGLHTSRTPYLGPTHAHLLGGEQSGRSPAHACARGRASASLPTSRPQTASSSTRVRTPLRSSLKKANPSRSTSPSASASSELSTPRSTFSRISLALSRGTGRSRLDKFLGRGIKSPSGSVASLNSSEGDFGAPRKAVRFMSVIEDESNSPRPPPHP